MPQDRLFTREQERFIREEYRTMSRKDLLKAFNARFGTSRSLDQLVSFIKRNGITSGRLGRFELGSRPRNSGTNGGVRANSGTFRKGNVPGNTRSMGAERIDPKDGYVLVKIRERNPYTGAETRFKFKHVAIWEATHGPVPEGHVVRFKDGDKMNFALGNLVLVTQAENLRLNQVGFSDAPEEARDVALTLARLECAVFARRREVGR